MPKLSDLQELVSIDDECLFYIVNKKNGLSGNITLGQLADALGQRLTQLTFCSHCGVLNLSKNCTCSQCGAPLPVEELLACLPGGI